jgi:hypothetical protein
MNEIAVTAIITALLLVALHYLPWRQILGAELSRLASYTLGVLSIALPASVMWIQGQNWTALIGLWSAIVAGGISVSACYLLDYILAIRWAAREKSEQTDQLRSVINEQTQP